MQSIDKDKATKYGVEWQHSVINAKTGDMITFGNYSWYVITKSSNTCTLLCTKCVTHMPYVKESHAGYVFWEHSSIIRSWLKDSFYEKFTAEEKSMLCLMKCSNREICPIGMNDEEMVGTSNIVSEEYVSLLSYIEAKNLPKNLCTCDESWWLRSVLFGHYHSDKCLGCGVHKDGSIARGFNLLKSFGVRPVIQLNFNKFSKSVISENQKKGDREELYKTERALKNTLHMMKETRTIVITLMISFLLSIVGCISTIGLVQALLHNGEIDEYVDQIFEFCRINFIPHGKGFCVVYILLYVAFTIYSLYLNQVEIECESGWKVFLLWIGTTFVFFLIPGIIGVLVFPKNMYHYILEYNDLKRSSKNYTYTINSLRNRLK